MIYLLKFVGVTALVFLFFLFATLILSVFYTFIDQLRDRKLKRMLYTKVKKQLKNELKKDL